MSLNLTVLEQKILELENSMAQSAADADQLFLVVMGMIVFFMQAGFALFEAGNVRAKNTSNILLKNFLNTAFGAIGYWLIGYGLSYGSHEPNSFIGRGPFALDNTQADSSSWLFQFMLAATASTIVGGAMAERTEFVAYILYYLFITSFVYPVVAHWGWTKIGWLSDWGYVDYAGSGIVHVCGGTAGLIGAVLVGPRVGRFDRNGLPVAVVGHSKALATLGGFILWFGFFAFNGGSEASVSNGSAQVVGAVVANTTISGAAGAITGLIVGGKVSAGRWQTGSTIAGMLAGCVAIGACVDKVDPWAAALIAIIGALLDIATNVSLIKLKVDDPMDSVGVHVAAGAWGVVACGFFQTEQGVFYGHGWSMLAKNIIGLLVIMGWSAFWALFLFGLLRYFKALRVTDEMQGRILDKEGGESPFRLRRSPSVSLTPMDNEERQKPKTKVVEISGDARPTPSLSDSILSSSSSDSTSE